MLNLLVIGLAAFRLARLIAFEEGPGAIFHTFRARLGAYDYGIAGLPATSLGRGVTCPYCVGVWAALGLYWLSQYSLTNWIVVCLAGAGIQTFLQNITDYLAGTNGSNN